MTDRGYLEAVGWTFDGKRAIVPEDANIAAVKLLERGSFLIVHPSLNPAHPGWQISRFGEDGTAWGHTVEASLQGAVDSARGIFGQWPPYGSGRIVEITHTTRGE